MKRTKIVATIGPACDDKRIMAHLIASGVNVARLNFSHGTHEEQQKRIDMIKEVREKVDMPVSIMLDTKGPEIRIKQFATIEGVELSIGQTFTLYDEDRVGDETGVSVTYAGLYKELKKGDAILIDDGLIKLNVREITPQHDIVCRVENGGVIKNNKSINIPDVPIKLPAITERDVEDLKFGCRNNVDFVAASFVRSKEDVRAIRKVLKENGGEHIMIISKIENRLGIANIDEIIAESDGIMVARGDLGVEVRPEEVPIFQKQIIRKCNMCGKPVITATQMLDSMIRNPRPTRAEVADVANAIFDGTDAVMLSGETAAGKYPVEAVNLMNEVAEMADAKREYMSNVELSIDEAHKLTDILCNASCVAAEEIGASAIVTPTGSGYSARMIAKFRPVIPIYAFTERESTFRQLALTWGVEPFLIEKQKDHEEMIIEALARLKKLSLVEPGDYIVFTAGLPVAGSGKTNSIRVEQVK